MSHKLEVGERRSLASHYTLTTGPTVAVTVSERLSFTVQRLLLCSCTSVCLSSAIRSFTDVVASVVVLIAFQFACLMNWFYHHRHRHRHHDV